jgi:quercetin dioxygenase-like cupin family protein
MDKLRVIAWDGDRLLALQELQKLMEQEGLHPYSWSNAPGDIYPAHTHAYHKVIYVARGSITWIIGENDEEYETHPGDRVELPRGTLHAARVGPQGVTCLEAHL